MIKVPVTDELGVFEARRAARDVAGELGFDRHGREEVVLIVSELASNIMKYGVKGDITIEIVDHENFGAGIKVTAHDTGPPFADFATALHDGYSDRGPIDPIDLPKRRGFGGGLGAIARLSDSVVHEPGAGEKRVCAIRYVRRPRGRS